MSPIVFMVIPTPATAAPSSCAARSRPSSLPRHVPCCSSGHVAGCISSHVPRHVPRHVDAHVPPYIACQPHVIWAGQERGGAEGVALSEDQNTSCPAECAKVVARSRDRGPCSPKISGTGEFFPGRPGGVLCEDGRARGRRRGLWWV
eukprot:2637117-Rhodomonas_salina.1